MVYQDAVHNHLLSFTVSKRERHFETSNFFLKELLLTVDRLTVHWV